MLGGYELPGGPDRVRVVLCGVVIDGCAACPEATAAYEEKRRGPE